MRRSIRTDAGQLVVISDHPAFTEFFGERETLIAYGLCLPADFPPGRKRLARGQRIKPEAGEWCAEGAWEIHRRASSFMVRIRHSAGRGERNAELTINRHRLLVAQANSPQFRAFMTATIGGALNPNWRPNRMFRAEVKALYSL